MHSSLGNGETLTQETTTTIATKTNKQKKKMKENTALDYSCYLKNFTFFISVLNGIFNMMSSN